MTKLLQVGNDIFEYPQQGTGQGHGEDATAWAEAVTSTLAGFFGPNDINLSFDSISNGDYDTDTAGSGSVVGLAFNLVEVRHTNIEFLIIRQYLRRITGINASDFFNAVTGVTESNVDINTNQINFVSHGLANGDIVQLTTTSGFLPLPLFQNQDYKIIVIDSDNFKLATLGDVEIDLSANPGGTFDVKKRIVDPNNDYIKAPSHGLENGQRVKIIRESGTLPTGLDEGPVYKVVFVDSDTIGLTDLNDITVDITDQGGDTSIFSIQEQDTTTISESGKIYANYNGSTFSVSIETVGDDTGVILDSDSTGQFTYLASPLPDQSLGQIYFKARTIDS